VFPSSCTSSSTLLSPQASFHKLGIKFDSRTANSLMREEPGVALRLLYSLKQSLSQVHKDVQVGFRGPHGELLGRHLQAQQDGESPWRKSRPPLHVCTVPMQKFQHTGKLGKELGASVPVGRALLDAQMHNTQKEAYTLNGQRCATTIALQHGSDEGGGVRLEGVPVCTHARWALFGRWHAQVL
jgi:hypothetical protein